MDERPNPAPPDSHRDDPSPERGGVWNFLLGRASGLTVQARDIHGSVVLFYVPARWRPLMRVVALVVASALLVGAVLVGFLLAGVPLPGRENAPQGSPPPGLGDPRTADPCALVDPTALSRFGLAELDSAYGGFNRCDVLVHQNGDYADVRLELRTRQDEESGAAVENLVEGLVTLRRLPEETDECQRELLPADREYEALITAEDGEPVLRCPMADALAISAANELGSADTIARRVPDRGSLAWRDACGLLDRAVLSGELGPVSEPDPGYARWECEWDAATSAAVIFDQGQPPSSPDDGRHVRLAGHDAFVWPEEDRCEVSVVHRVRSNRDDEPIAEMVIVSLHDGRPAEQLCAPATRLASVVANRLGR